MFNKKLKKENKDLKEQIIELSRSIERIGVETDNAVPWANHDMTSEERSSKAKEIASNPLMMEIFEGIEAGLTSQARNADLSNHTQLIAYTQGLQILEQMIEYIESRVNDQKVVEYYQKVVGLKH